MNRLRDSALPHDAARTTAMDEKRSHRESPLPTMLDIDLSAGGRMFGWLSIRRHPPPVAPRPRSGSGLLGGCAPEWTRSVCRSTPTRVGSTRFLPPGAWLNWTRSLTGWDHRSGRDPTSASPVRRTTGGTPHFIKGKANFIGGPHARRLRLADATAAVCLARTWAANSRSNSGHQRGSSGAGGGGRG